ncbi:MAG: NADH-quinone oxidoreductase subunit L, partial [Acidobacteria bacterium]|nr:NADH-quinone oxidoreductase subunit L [Acidobacteriota bacterium]
AVAVSGIVVARAFYIGDRAYERPRRLAERFPLAYKLIANKYFIDELYDATVVQPIHRLATFCWKGIDVILIDGVGVNGTAFTTELSGDLLRFLQTGNVRNYALSVVMGVLLLVVILW